MTYPLSSGRGEPLQREAMTSRIRRLLLGTGGEAEVIEAVILIPGVSNDGERYPEELLMDPQRRLVAIAGGLTIEFEAQGMAPDGRIISERVVPYDVALRSWWQLPAWLSVVEWAREAFGQEAIFVRVAGVPEVGPP